jgi:NAD(P)-dependent dehydrogenase (short-subunit alcohol dehydrogenase family)
MSARPKLVLQDRVVLISGAGSGIGAAGAIEFARQGARPVLLDVDTDGLARTAAAVAAAAPGAASSPQGPTAPLCLRTDVTQAAANHEAVQATLARYGRIDIVWANAGIASFGPLSHTDPAAFARCIDVNVMGTFHLVRAALPSLLSTQGFVAVTASAASFAHAPLMSAYAASKAAVEALCNAWRIELHAHGVGVAAIHPHWVRTALIDEGSLHPAFVRLRRSMPAVMNRELPAEDAARLIVKGIAARQRRIWVPGWVRWLHWLRPLLHTEAGERASLQAAPDMEALYLQGLAAEGALASSFGPRERERALQRSAEPS